MGALTITPEAFITAWGREVPLVRYGSGSLDLLAIAQEDKAFLTEAGLPAWAAPFLDFRAPESGTLPTVGEVYDEGEEFRRYRIVGSDGVGNPIAIDEERNGEVVLLDHDDNFARSLINTSVRQLAESLLIYRDTLREYRAEDASEGALTAEGRQQLHVRLKQIDPMALRANCFWPDETLIIEASDEYPAPLLRDLSSPDAKVRLKASKTLESELRKAATPQRKAHFGNLGVTSALIEALDDPDPKIVHNAVVALAQVSEHYYKDDRAYPRLLVLTRSTHPLTARWAIGAVIQLRGEASLDDVLPLCFGSSAEARSMALSHLYRWRLHYANDVSVSPESEARMRDAAIRALEDEDATVRGDAASLLGVVGDVESLPLLQKSLQAEKHWLAKQSMENAVKSLQARR